MLLVLCRQEIRMGPLLSKCTNLQELYLTHPGGAQGFVLPGDFASLLPTLRVLLLDFQRQEVWACGKLSSCKSPNFLPCLLLGEEHEFAV